MEHSRVYFHFILHNHFCRNIGKKMIDPDKRLQFKHIKYYTKSRVSEKSFKNERYSLIEFQLGGLKLKLQYSINSFV